MAIRTNQIQDTRITAVEFCAQYMPFPINNLNDNPPQNTHIIFTIYFF